MTARQCGTCTMCCRLLNVPEIKKADGEWCPHCKPGKGCTIYPERPETCRKYSCTWLLNPHIPDEWYPLRSKLVLDTVGTAPHPEEHRRGVAKGRAMLRVHVHPHYPDRWREEPFYSGLKGLARDGLSGRYGANFIVAVCVGSKLKWVVLPKADIPYKLAPGHDPGEPTKEHAMPSFSVKSRTLGPVVEATVDATSLGQAIDKTAQEVPDGAELQVIHAEEVPVASPPEGAKAEQKALPAKHA